MDQLGRQQIGWATTSIHHQTPPLSRVVCGTLSLDTHLKTVSEHQVQSMARTGALVPFAVVSGGRFRVIGKWHERHVGRDEVSEEGEAGKMRRGKTGTELES